MDFAESGPLVRPGLPHIRFLFVRSRLCFRASFRRRLAEAALAPRLPFVSPYLGRGLSPPSCQTCSAHPEPWTPRTRPPLLGKPADRFSTATTGSVFLL